MFFLLFLRTLFILRWKGQMSRSLWFPDFDGCQHKSAPHLSTVPFGFLMSTVRVTIMKFFFPSMGPSHLNGNYLFVMKFNRLFRNTIQGLLTAHALRLRNMQPASATLKVSFWTCYLKLFLLFCFSGLQGLQEKHHVIIVSCLTECLCARLQAAKISMDPSFLRSTVDYLASLLENFSLGKKFVILI